MEKQYTLIVSKNGKNGKTNYKPVYIPESKLTDLHKETLLGVLIQHWNNTPEDVKNTFMHDIFTRLKQVDEKN